MAADSKETLVTWLRDAYAMEGQAMELLEMQIQRLEHYPQAQDRMRQHLDETRAQQAKLHDCLGRLGADPSGFKESVMRFGANMQGIMHAMASDEVMKHALASYAFEQFESACYQSLSVAAKDAGEHDVARVCDDILRQEQAMAGWLWQHLPQVTSEYLARSAHGAEAKR